MSGIAKCANDTGSIILKIFRPLVQLMTILTVSLRFPNASRQSTLFGSSSICTKYLSRYIFGVKSYFLSQIIKMRMNEKTKSISLEKSSLALLLAVLSNLFKDNWINLSTLWFYLEKCNMATVVPLRYLQDTRKWKTLGLQK